MKSRLVVIRITNPISTICKIEKKKILIAWNHKYVVRKKLAPPIREDSSILLTLDATKLDRGEEKKLTKKMQANLIVFFPSSFKCMVEWRR